MAQYGTTITDIDIPFTRVVAILLRWMLASLLASLIFSIFLVAVVALVTVLTGGSLPSLLRMLPR